MYKLLSTTLVSYIKNAMEIEVFDANETFVDPDDYATFSILTVNPVSPHSNLIDTYKDEVLNTKKFVFAKSSSISVRIDFRGSEASANMSIFEASFCKEAQKEILNGAGFGFLGLGSVSPITALRNTKAKSGMTTTLTLSNTQNMTDDSQIIESVTLNVSNTL
jgi:hypothetical protein